MPKQVWLNNYESALIAPVIAAPVTGTPATELGYGIIQLNGAAGTVLPALTGGDWFLLTLYSMAGSLETNIEIVRVTSIDTTSGSETRLTVQRAQEGTIAQAYATGDKVSMRMTAGSATNMLQNSDNLAGLDDTAAARGNLAAEAAIATGTTAQYWRGDKNWRDFATDVRAAVLTGLSTATGGVITATDTVLSALGRLQKQFSDHFGSGGTAHSNAVGGGAAGFMSGTDKTKLDGVAAGATANSSDATLLARANHTGTQAISTVTELQTALDAKQANLVSGTNIKTINGVSVLGSGELTIAAGDISTVGVTYNADGSVNTVTEDAVVKTYAYNTDGTVNTIAWPVAGGKTRTQTFAYTGDVLTGMTATEV